MVEEPTEYRGYTNPNVQSRSFKILQESLSYSEANEEGIVLPSGNTPGESIVRKAYSEGRRRLEELSEINPRNFTQEGQSPYKITEHYNIVEESVISDPSQCVQHDPNVTVVAAKTYDGSEPRRRKRPTPNVDIAHSSVLSPAAGQQQYLQQAKEHYQTQQEHVQQQHAVPQHMVAQQAVVHQRRSPEKPLKLVNYQFDEQYSHMRRDPGPVQTQQVQIVQTNRQKAVVTPQKSNDFIPATETVSSVAADLDLKILSPGAVPQQTFEVRQTTRTVENQIVRQPAQTVKPAEQRAQPTAQISKPVQQVAKPVEQTVQSTVQVVKTTEQIVRPVEQINKPSEQVIKPAEPVEITTVKTVEAVEETVKPEEQIVKPTQDAVKVTEINSSQAVIVQAETNKQTESIESQKEESLKKFAEDLSASVVASAQETIKTTIATEKTISENVDGCLVSKESTVESVTETVITETEPEPKPVPKQEEEAKVEPKPAESLPEDIKEPEPEKVEITATKEIVTKTEEITTDETTVKEDVSQSEVTVQAEESETVQITATKEPETKAKEITAEVSTVKEEVSQSAVTVQGEESASTVVIEEVQTVEEKIPEAIPTATVEKSKDEIEVNTEASTTITEENVQTKRRPSLQVPDIDTEINVSAHITEEASSTVEEASTEKVVESSSEEISISTQVEAVISSGENIVESNEQTVNIVTDVQAEEQSFSISVGETAETSEVVEMTIDTNEASESSAAFQISTDAEVTMDISSDINISTDVSADVATEESADASAAVTLSLGQEADESESSSFTVSVSDESGDGSSEVSKPKRKIAEPNENGQNKPKPARAKFVDSQGGVAARLARFKQK